MNSLNDSNTLARCPRRPVSTADASELRVTFGIERGRAFAELRYFDLMGDEWRGGKGLRIRAEELTHVGEAFLEAARRSGIAATRTEAA